MALLHTHAHANIGFQCFGLTVYRSSRKQTKSVLPKTAQRRKRCSQIPFFGSKHGFSNTKVNVIGRRAWRRHRSYLNLTTLDTMEKRGGGGGGGGGRERERETLSLSRFAGGYAVPWLTDDRTEGAAFLLNYYYYYYN